ncbi:Iron-binding zinc finger CDGSH type [Fasciolopsis buskii]|uniref:Iron-binding zinc finger CDGSH type n=1 Tax=Fasciolopsis buskii TaxID=27845 RepID=A0A8E0S2N8_9TREM|nr:Iron-binding zinc finger CDGSH type [Fasciolopsis buski]
MVDGAFLLFDLSTVISTDAYNPNSKHKPRIADKLPLKMICEPNRIYWWCSCGHSVNQPFCDGHHIRIIGQTPHFKINKPQFKPIKVTFKEKTEVWWCTCKQTNEPPYCDGSHKSAEVQSAFRY